MSNYYGKTGDLIITDIQFNDALDDVPSGTITCTFPGSLTEAIAAAPDLGSSTEHLPETDRLSLGQTVRVRLVLKSRVFSGGKDGSVTVTLKYGFREEDADSTDAQETSYQVQSKESKTSILLHPRYAKVEERERLLANALLEGTKPYETVYLNKKKLEIQTRIDSKDKDNYTMTTLAEAIATVVKSDLGKELIGKIQKGITDYNTYGCTFVETSYSTGMETAINHLGKITSPPGHAPKGESWLLTGLDANKERGEQRWTIRKTWTSADAGATWDEELYK